MYDFCSSKNPKNILFTTAKPRLWNTFAVDTNYIGIFSFKYTKRLETMRFR